MNNTWISKWPGFSSKPLNILPTLALLTTILLPAVLNIMQISAQQSKSEGVPESLRKQTAELSERLIACLQKWTPETEHSQSGTETSFSISWDALSASYSNYTDGPQSEWLSLMDERNRNRFSEYENKPEFPFRFIPWALSHIDGVPDIYTLTGDNKINSPEEVHKIYRQALLGMLDHPQCLNS